MGAKWTQDDIDYLIANAGSLKVAELCKALGRSVGGIQCKANKLRVRLRGVNAARREGYTQCEYLTKEQKAEMLHRKNKNETLCWRCYHATNPEGKCPWSARFEPVEGWTADKGWVRIGDYSTQKIESYFVRACPLFKEG
ncbi:MAG TPA: hypothetical protein DEA44_16810 [Firmicutes bacterium]|nr:hypothetical protein [Bacillota bacterium]